MDSSVHVLSNSSRPPAGSAAPRRNESTGTSFRPSDPFASLEQEATQTYQVSNELLQLARDSLARENAAGGATKAYEVPAELMEMARRNKLARAAAKRSKAASAPESSDVAPTDAKGLPASGPRLSFSELSEEEREWVESALTKAASRADTVEEIADSGAPSPASIEVATIAAVVSDVAALESEPRAELQSAPAPVSGAVPKKRRSRWLLTATCVVTVSVLAVLSVWMVRAKAVDGAHGSWGGAMLRSLVAVAGERLELTKPSN